MKRIIYILLLLPIITFGQHEVIGTENTKGSLANNSQQIFKRLNFHRAQHNFDSAIFYNDVLLQSKSTTGGIITAYFQKIDTYRLFNKFNDGLRLALSTFDEYCAEDKDMEQCHSCRYIYDKLVEFMISMQDYRQAIRYLNMNCSSEWSYKRHYDKALLYTYLQLPDSALMLTSA
ncbi:MAG: hypothetical protein JKY54_06645, partial [Flavobacteriales bacterium]|nr:hypothetical protein [Flavobacteriales bacterium]